MSLDGFENRGIKRSCCHRSRDGSIMSLDFALKRRWNILSGPAASTHGGVFLPNTRIQIIVDIEDHQ